MLSAVHVRSWRWVRLPFIMCFLTVLARRRSCRNDQAGRILTNIIWNAVPQA
jgi:hypothetical protein